MAIQEEQLGFECEFVEDPPEYLQTDCPICLEILREPYQVTCCGKSYCKDCIGRVRSKCRPCPCCKQDNFDLFPNKGLQQPLYGFKVLCTHQHKGCEWTGELRQLDYHLNMKPTDDNELVGCKFANIKCSYCCELVMRNKLVHHKTKLCNNRPFSCDYCGHYESTYEDVTHNHWPICGSHPVQCPNKCGKFLHRQNLKHHESNECPVAVVDCEFNYAGCETKLPRKDMPDHITASLTSHISLLAKSHRKQQETIVALTKEIATLRVQTTELKSHVSILPVDFIVESPLSYTAFKVWSSTPFYTHCRGYKLTIRFTKLAAYYIGVYVIPGEFDALLKWPFKGVVRVQVVNRYSESLNLLIKVDNGGRVKDGESLERCGRVAISDISPFLDSDCLQLRVVSVDFN